MQNASSVAVPPAFFVAYLDVAKEDIEYMPDSDNIAPANNDAKVTLAVLRNELVHLRAEVIASRVVSVECLNAFKVDVAKFIGDYRADVKALELEMRARDKRIDKLEAVVAVLKWGGGIVSIIVAGLLLSWLKQVFGL